MDELQAARKQLALSAALIRKLRARIRDLEKSRDLWRLRATQRKR